MNRFYKTLILILIGVCLLLWVRRSQFKNVSYQCFNLTCSYYQKNLITGSICHKICENFVKISKNPKRFKLLQVITSFFQVFEIDGAIYVCSFPFTDKLNKYEYNSFSNFKIPVIDNVSSLISNIENLFTDQSKNILRHLDFNEDAIINQPEINSFLTLIKLNDFKYQLLFWDAPYFAQLIGICGPIYSIRNPGHTFSAQGKSWVQRAALAINLILLVIDIQHRSTLPFYAFANNNDSIVKSSIYKSLIPNPKFFPPNLSKHNRRKDWFGKINVRTTNRYQTKFLFPSEVLTISDLDRGGKDTTNNNNNNLLIWYKWLCDVLDGYFELFDLDEGRIKRSLNLTSRTEYAGLVNVTNNLSLICSSLYSITRRRLPGELNNNNNNDDNLKTDEIIHHVITKYPLVLNEYYSVLWDNLRFFIPRDDLNPKPNTFSPLEIGGMSGDGYSRRADLSVADWEYVRSFEPSLRIEDDGTDPAPENRYSRYRTLYALNENTYELMNKKDAQVLQKYVDEIWFL